MANAKWQMADGRWKMANKTPNGKRQTMNAQCQSPRLERRRTGAKGRMGWSSLWRTRVHGLRGRGAVFEALAQALEGAVILIGVSRGRGVGGLTGLIGLAQFLTELVQMLGANAEAAQESGGAVFEFFLGEVHVAGPEQR